MSDTTVDLVVDLNSEDDTGLPWEFIDQAAEPTRNRRCAPEKSLGVGST